MHFSRMPFILGVPVQRWLIENSIISWYRYGKIWKSTAFLICCYPSWFCFIKLSTFQLNKQVFCLFAMTQVLCLGCPLWEGQLFNYKIRSWSVETLNGKENSTESCLLCVFVWTLQPQIYVHIHFQNWAFILGMILITERTNICILRLCCTESHNELLSDLHHLLILIQLDWLSSPELKRRYLEECFNCFYPYNENQWSPKQINIGSHWLSLYVFPWRKSYLFGIKIRQLFTDWIYDTHLDADSHSISLMFSYTVSVVFSIE